MLIRMLTTARGVEDGFACHEYVAGRSYDAAHALACHFVNRGYAIQLAPHFEETIMNALHPRLLTRVAAPAIEPVTLAETKLYLRVDASSEDDLINGLIASARVHAEEYLRISLITQQWKLAYNDAPPECARLPRGPVQSVDDVSTITRDGTVTAFSPALYYLNAAKDTLVFDSTPLAHRVEILYTTGYGSIAASVPEPIRNGMLAHIAALYDFRGEGNDALPTAAVAFYAPFREVIV